MILPAKAKWKVIGVPGDYIIMMLACLSHVVFLQPVVIYSLPLFFRALTSYHGVNGSVVIHDKSVKSLKAKNILKVWGSEK